MTDVRVTVEMVEPRLLAAVRRRVDLGEVGASVWPALDYVGAFLRSAPGLRTDGPNVFLYHHASAGAGQMDVDFGVEVTRSFEPSGEVRAVEVPGGRAAVAVHVGSYTKLHDTHQALHRWCEGNQLRIGSHSWEIYGDMVEDEAKLETTIVYLLA